MLWLTSFLLPFTDPGMLSLVADKRLVFILLSCISLYSREIIAGEVTSVQVDYREGVYAVSIDAQIDAPRTYVYRLLTDYDKLTRISPSVIESRVLIQLDDHVHRTTLVTRLCVLFYCKNLRQTQDMVQHPEGLLTAMIVPKDSDFKGGFARWRLSRRNVGTRLQFDAHLQPDFWVPSFAGQFILKIMLTKEAVYTVQGLEDRYKEMQEEMQ